MAVVGQHRVVFEGAAAVVRLGYQRAAVLGPWRVEGDTLTARVLDVDGFRITQGPLTLEITNLTGLPTVRPLADVTVYQGQLTARLVRKTYGGA
jgi:hypothetical protein